MPVEKKLTKVLVLKSLPITKLTEIRLLEHVKPVHVVERDIICQSIKIEKHVANVD